MKGSKNTHRGNTLTSVYASIFMETDVNDVVILQHMESLHSIGLSQETMTNPSDRNLKETGTQLGSNAGQVDDTC